MIAVLSVDTYYWIREKDANLDDRKFKNTIPGCQRHYSLIHLWVAFALNKRAKPDLQM
jgi:hypothetical protein